jgi:peroxisomal 3,2-trans-enoyl-CoA isomerase
LIQSSNFKTTPYLRQYFHNSKSSLSPQAYDEWLAALQDASKDPSVLVTILTGRGKYYSSGQELALPKGDAVDPEEFLKERARVTVEIGETMINFPKLLIAAVNGECW